MFSSNPGMVGGPKDVELMNDETKDYGKVDWFLAAPDRTLRISSAESRTKGLILMYGVGTSNPKPTGIWDGTNGQPVFSPLNRPPLNPPSPKYKPNFPF